MPECSEDVLFAAPKVCVHLSRQKSVLRHVCPPRIVVQGQQKEPNDTDGDAKRRNVWGDLEQPRIATQ
jgi:hypothetical protein